MSFWKCAYSLKLPTFYKRNNLNFVQICCYHIIGTHNINGKKNVMKPNSCIYERRCTFFKRTSTEFEKILKMNDDVPSDYKLIYRIPFTFYLKMARYVVLCSSGAIPFIISSKFISFPLINEMDLSNLATTDFDFNILISSFFVTNIVISLFISKFPVRIYANENGKHKSIFLGILPWTLSTLSYEKGEVEKVEPYLTILPWSDHYFRMKTKKTVILPYYFRKPADLHNMLKCDDT